MPGFDKSPALLYSIKRDTIPKGKSIVEVQITSYRRRLHMIFFANPTNDSIQHLSLKIIDF